MANDFYNSPADIAPATRARSVDINAIDAAVNAAFDKLPSEERMKRGTINYVITDGDANAYTIELAYPPLSYIDGMQIVAKFHTPNTTNSTVNVNGLGIVPVKLTSGGDVSPGDLSGIVDMRYNSTIAGFMVSANAANAAAAAANSANLADAARQQAQAAAAVAQSGAAFPDTNPIVKGSADATKQMRFEVDGNVPTGTMRVVNAPAADGTMATQEYVASHVASVAPTIEDVWAIALAI